ncbi:hypothetical protein K788_0005329 [Paraburkholderia caribensis MBA4]|uniref:Uncharacterized protein n=1 Tax=Paraburkholderia caribensis MBA4 TaxID=1323664 RepID=A0A0N7JUR2_9BURK|nr:hypothetical protein [Paraburkholderia caribensis]ALL67125.1 hypothetical protein K788_0005329 [Paraburkholderia caribensis MBA4]
MTLAYSPPVLFVSGTVDACGLSPRFRGPLLALSSLVRETRPGTFLVQRQKVEHKVKRQTRRAR